jgi:hypothetical protein
MIVNDLFNLFVFNLLQNLSLVDPTPINLATMWR